MRSRTAGNATIRRLVAAATVALVGAAPFVVFRGLFQDAATDFRWEFLYLVSGWTPFILMFIGALWFVPVVLSMERTGYSRLYLRPARRGASSPTRSASCSRSRRPRSPACSERAGPPADCGGRAPQPERSRLIASNA